MAEESIIKATDCPSFCNAHCSYDCPNIRAEEFEQVYDIPASDAGMSRVKCPDCDYNPKHCDCTDCYFYMTIDCPRYKNEGGADEVLL